MFRTYDDAGRLQLDPDFFTHVLKTKGSAATVARTFGNTNPSGATIVLPNNLRYPFIAIECSHKIGLLRSWVLDGQRRFDYVSSGPPGTPFNYWVFDSSETIGPAGPGGLTMWDPSGNFVTFSSDASWLMPVDLMNFSGTEDGPPIHLPGKRLAFCQSALGSHRYTTLFMSGGQVPGGGWEEPSPDPGDGEQQGVWSARLDGKLYGASAIDGRVTMGPISFDDVTARLGYGTEQWAQAQIGPDWTTAAWGLAVDVTNL